MLFCDIYMTELGLAYLMCLYACNPWEWVNDGVVHDNLVLAKRVYNH